VNIVGRMIILTVEHENDSQTRMMIGCEDKARELYHKLVHAGYRTRATASTPKNLPVRDEQEMRRVSAIMNEVNYDPVPNRVLP
jgi:hypothetical protein